MLPITIPKFCCFLPFGLTAGVVTNSTTVEVIDNIQRLVIISTWIFSLPCGGRQQLSCPVLRPTSGPNARPQDSTWINLAEILHSDRGLSLVAVQNFSQIYSTVSEKKHRKQTYREIANLLYWHCHGRSTPCPDKKGATDFFAVTYTNIDGFS